MMRSALLWASRNAFLERQFRKRGFARRAIRRFMPGEDLGSALVAAEELKAHGIGCVLTRLGEEVRDAGEADGVVSHYEAVAEQIVHAGLDGEISVKPTQLGLSIGQGPPPEREGYAITESNLATLAHAAGRSGRFVWVDMEGSEYVDATLKVVRAVHARHRNVGVCLQAYLYRTPDDVAPLVEAGIRIRLVKGAYREPASIAYPKKKDVDAAFVSLAERLMDERGYYDAAPPHFGTHDMALVDTLRGMAEERDMPLSALHVTMLYGIARDAQHRLARDGLSIRTLISYGEAWYPWYVRRLAERPANVWFVVKSMFG